MRGKKYIGTNIAYIEVVKTEVTPYLFIFQYITKNELPAPGAALWTPCVIFTTSMKETARVNAKAPENLIIGINFIDNQHTNIYDQIYKIVMMIRQGRPAVEIRHETNNLEKIIDIHQKAEERYMKKYFFAGYEEHRREHHVFMKNLVILKNLFLKKGSSNKLADIIESQFEEWSRNHVQNYDRQLAAFLIKNNLAK